MMKRKVLGMMVALVLASIGTASLVAYVRSAKEEAVAGEQLVDVYVLETSLDRGATADQIRDALRKEQVPIKVRAEDAITDPSAINPDTIAAVRLEAGEQLLASRLVNEATLTRLTVPDGFQELTIALEPQRAVGGELRPGDTVGVVLSFEPFELDASGLQPNPEASPSSTEAPPVDGSTTTTTPEKSPNMTHFVFHKVLVTQVQFVISTSPNGAPADTIAQVGTAPSTDVLVTMALTSDQVEQVVFAAEFGRVWLTSEGEKADTTGTRIVTLGESIGSGLTQ